MNIDDQLKKLNEAEEEQINKLKNEKKTEDEIISAIADTVSNLIKSDKCEVALQDKRYLVKFSVSNSQNINSIIPKKIMVLVAADITKATIFQGRYKPMTLKLDYNDALCFKDNLTVLVEAFIRHITGTIKPEMLEQEERPVDVEVRRHEES